MAHFHGSVSGKHVHGDGSWAVAPAFGTITPAATSITFAHVGGGTHYRIYATGGSAGSFVSLPGSPVTVSGLTTNQPYTIDLSADGSTVAATTNTGTTNPATGGGEPVPNVPITLQFAQETDAAVPLVLAQALGVAVESDEAVQLLQPGALDAAQETDEAVPLVLVSPMVLGVAAENDEAVSLASPSSGGSIAPAALWGYVLSNGQSVGDNIVAIRLALEAMSGGVNVARMNGAPVIGDGTEGNPWRGVGVSP